VTLLEETHIKDLKMKRDTWESAEKLKRDKWIQEKTKLIKDQTLKGLEPEIQRLIAQHKTQMKRLEDKHAQNLVDQREQLAEQHQELVEQYRDRIAAERRRAMEEEREFARQRYQKQLERDEMEFQQQKRKLQASFEEQKDRMVQSFKDEMQQKEQSSRKLIDDLKNSLETARLDRQRAMDDLAKKHQLEVCFDLYYLILCS
jgi:hypothetical protein